MSEKNPSLRIKSNILIIGAVFITFLCLGTAILAVWSRSNKVGAEQPQVGLPLPSPMPATVQMNVSLTPTSFKIASSPLSTTTQTTPTSLALPIVTVQVQATPEELPINEYKNPNGGVTVAVPSGGRYIVVGDSISYGSTMQGQTNYESICEHRWPYLEQLALETGIKSTASLDRGDSMKTPFYSEKTVLGKVINYCDPPEGTPLLNTSVPGSNTNEWLSDLAYYPALVDSLNRPENNVILFLIGADIFAEKIGKPPVTVDEYEQNVGQLLVYLTSFKKVVYVGYIPHVRVGSFISSSELEATNQKIDEFNQRLASIIASNGYQNSENGQKVDFGQQELIQDGLDLWVNAIQAGPKLDQVTDTFSADMYAKDGLHFHPEGYNLIGKAWAEALKSPIQVIKAFKEN